MIFKIVCVIMLWLTKQLTSINQRRHFIFQFTVNNNWHNSLFDTLFFFPIEAHSRLAAKYAKDPHWKYLVLFYELFHGDTGRGVGAR